MEENLVLRIAFNLNISDLFLISLTWFQMFFRKFFTESRIKNIDFAIDFIKQYILVGQFWMLIRQFLIHNSIVTFQIIDFLMNTLNVAFLWFRQNNQSVNR